MNPVAENNVAYPRGEVFVDAETHVLQCTKLQKLEKRFKEAEKENE